MLSFLHRGEQADTPEEELHAQLLPGERMLWTGQPRRFWPTATWYGVTSRRVLVIEGRAHRQLTSVVLATVPEIELHEARDGTGTILLKAPTQRSLLLATRTSRVDGPPLRLTGVPLAARVHRLLLAAQKEELRELAAAGAVGAGA